jgi:CRISPR locus-related DNA-binding protein
MVKLADTKEITAREGVEKIRHATTSRARYMRLDVTLIATFYSVEPLMPAALAFQPKKIILLVNKLEGDAQQNIEKVKETFGKLVEVKAIKMPQDDIVGFASKMVEILDTEAKNSMIVVSVGGGWRLATSGALYGCYARPDRVYKIVNNTLEGNKVSELPKLGYNIGSQKERILEIITKEKDKTVAQIANQLGKTRGMIYQHLRELREQGYVDDDFNITDAGRLALL